jgi:hypothetical protein
MHARFVFCRSRPTNSREIEMAQSAVELASRKADDSATQS